MHQDETRPAPEDVEDSKAETATEDAGQDEAKSEAKPRTSVDELELSLEFDDSADVETDEGEAGEEESSVPRAEQLAAQIESLQAESDAHRDKWLRAMAELENFRKRTRRDFESSINLAKASVFRQLLEVVDNFERALASVDAEAESGEMVQGVQLIRDQLLKVLRDNDVHRIEALGRPFDPNLHEAVSQIETDEVEGEHVAQVVQEGYVLGDMVLRPAAVVVAR
jgi:molecular chaperone GrpE